MKIAIDTHFITSGPATGNRTYVAELVQAMISLNTSHEFLLYSIEDHPFYRQFDSNDRVTTKNVLSNCGITRNFISIPLAVAKDKPDIVHLLYICPPFLNAPKVMTVHDLFYFHQKNVGLYNHTIGQISKWSIPRADKVITISEYSRQDIIDVCKVDSSHVTSIPLGINKRFKQIDDCFTIREKLGIKRDYILYVGRTEDPRKNLITLIDAFSQLKKETSCTEQLVIAGRHGTGTEQLYKRAMDHGLNEHIIFPGIVKDNDLPALLSGAKLFVYPSSFEGFGLPILEAMACGVPVITSPVSSLPEVADNAALMVTPGNASALFKTMRDILNDEHLQDVLRIRGKNRASLYTWDKVARSTIEIYEQVISSAKN